MSPAIGLPTEACVDQLPAFLLRDVKISILEVGVMVGCCVCSL